MMLKLHATAEEVMRAVETVQEMARSKGASEKTIFNLGLALEECASNVVNHALQRNAQETFEVEIETTDDAFVIELRDRGAEFDPTAATEGKPQAEENDLPGGWGIMLARKAVDDI